MMSVRRVNDKQAIVVAGPALEAAILGEAVWHLVIDDQMLLRHRLVNGP